MEIVTGLVAFAVLTAGILSMLVCGSHSKTNGSGKSCGSGKCDHSGKKADDADKTPEVLSSRPINF